MKATPSALRDHIINPEFRGELLWCPNCGGEYTAHAGDYFMWLPDTPIKCECGEQLLLVRKKVIIEDVQR
jgi:hypothetical protein